MNKSTIIGISIFVYSAIAFCAGLGVGFKWSQAVAQEQSDLKKWGYGQLNKTFGDGYPSAFFSERDDLIKADRRVAKENYIYDKNNRLIEIYYREVNPNEPSHSGREQSSDQNLDK